MKDKIRICFVKQWISIFLTSLLVITPSVADTTKPITYFLSYQSYNTQCVFYVNGVQALQNYTDKGPLYSGVTVTAYLENGLNTISSDMAALSESEELHTYSADAYCKFDITRRVINDFTEPDSFDLFQLVASVDEHLQPIVQQLKQSYDKELLPAVVGKLNGKEWYRVSQQFEVNDIPEWIWTKATPFEATEENMAKLRQAYLEVWQAMQDKNIPLFKELNKISFHENEIASNYPDDEWYYSLDFDEDFDESGGMKPINWNNYSAVAFNKDRLVKLVDSNGRSPLITLDKQGDPISAYNPYFSLIDGKMILTR